MAEKAVIKKHKKALLIGGGAPNSTLMAGALVAFLEHGVEFDVISTSGAGALMGLLYAAPKAGDPIEALRQWAQIGVSDPIYGMLPVNYKVFMKPGAEAAAYRDWLARNPFTAPFFDPSSPFGSGLFSDWVKLGLATMSPSNLSPSSLGLCAHLPFAEQVVDFDAIAAVAPEFYINAYNMNREKMVIWGKDEITPEHLKAAFSFPLIYPPYTLDGEDYIEGAAIDTLNFKALVNDDPASPGKHCDIDTLVVFDILGADKLIRKPRGLYDAWVHSIITPLVEIAKDDIRLFEYKHNIDPATGQPKRQLLKVDLMGGIPDEHWPQVMDWTSSNLELLFDVGYRAGQAFYRDHAAALDLAEPPGRHRDKAAATEGATELV
ncbi:patatin-like phospholipase [Pseudogulbenkiania sp. NH8B]|uniref:patatin-like phospholipase family protein n=1 Tax=Pseudogulbenkiania sp. (strain NH8B) TaxID=748280 RepID=UPI0002279AD2|nr:patatin-like phospholipase family protein [Pseudogulbenkiania sp. NH8B]BAK76877.1 patatin-like phospholipase [Pseudogulbenkiania sp. NH8B]